MAASAVVFGLAAGGGRLAATATISTSGVSSNPTSTAALNSSSTAKSTSSALGALPPAASRQPPADPSARQERFLYLLRTYPQRPPRDTLGQVERLVEQGDFPDHDRAEAWLGSAWLALQEREAARRWFERVARDHRGSVWVERSWLGLGDAAAQERRYGIALAWYAKARTARDAAVREMGRVSEQSTLTLRARQRWAWTAGGLALVIVGLLAASLGRHPPLRLWPLPAEARIVLPVLAVLALLSVRQDPAPRAAILELCMGAAFLVTLSGLRLRAALPRGTARALHTAGTLAALGALAYVAVYRGELVGMLLETLRAGPG